MRSAVGLALALVLACKPGQNSNLKSFLGLNAGQDQILRDGSAPTFQALSDWFLTFKAKAVGPGISSRAAGQALPSAQRATLVRYFEHEIARTGQLKEALELDDDRPLVALLERESFEVLDIAMAIVDERYQPRHGDLFAKFITMTRGRTNLIDRFALGPLDRALQNMLLADAERVLEEERKHFFAGLLKLYRSEAGKVRLRNDLEHNLRVLTAMKKAVEGGTDGLNLPDDDSMSGIPATFLTFHDRFVAQQRQRLAAAAAPGSAAGSGMGNAARAGNEPLLTADQQDPPLGLHLDVFKKVPAIAGKDGDVDPNGKMPDPSVGSGLASIRPNIAVRPLPPALPALPVAPSGPVMPATPAEEEIYPPDWDSSAPTLALTGGPPPLGPADFDCRGRGLTGMGMVFCQRNLAYANMVVRPNVGTANPNAAKQTTVTSAAPVRLPNVAIEVARDLVHASDVTSQGPHPTCSQEAVHGAALVALRREGLSPNLLDRPYDVFYGEQNAKPTMADGIAGFQQHYAGRISVTAETLMADMGSGFALAGENVDAATPLKTWIAAGKSLYVGAEIGPSWGLGEEFQDNGDSLALTTVGEGAAGPLVKPDEVVTCQPGSKRGHAFLVISYVVEAGKLYLLVKNSWGDQFKMRGTAWLDYSTCINALEVYGLTFKVGG